MPGPDFHAAARREFDTSMDYYEDAEEGLGRRFKTAVNEAIRSLQQDKLAGFPSELDTRTIIIKKFPFKIVFGDFSGRTVIIAVAHTARHPDYWHHRLDDISE